jgi:hypothetical protein
MRSSPKSILNRSGLMTLGNMIVCQEAHYSVLQQTTIVDPANFTVSTYLNHYNLFIHGKEKCRWNITLHNVGYHCHGNQCSVQWNLPNASCNLLFWRGGVEWFIRWLASVAGGRVLPLDQLDGGIEAALDMRDNCDLWHKVNICWYQRGLWQRRDICCITCNLLARKKIEEYSWFYFFLLWEICSLGKVTHSLMTGAISFAFIFVDWVS